LDLHPIALAATADEIAAIEAVLAPRVPPDETTMGAAEAAALRHWLLPALHAAQACRGWISAGALGHICKRLHVPPAEGYGVASFYSMFALAPRAPDVVHICDDIVCRAAGAERLCAQVEARHGHAGEDNARTWLRSPCLGLCEQAPAAMLCAAGAKPFERAWGKADASSVSAALETRHVAPPAPAVIHQDRASLTLLRRVGLVDPTSLDSYRAHGGYAALRRAFEIGPAAVVREVTDSKLQGRGGAAFPTGRKWAAVAAQPARPHYLVCNADESEPGTFKDRILMECDPFALVESMTIAGFATGCELGYIYIRGEYPFAAERLQAAISQARARGFLGADVMGKGVAFDLEVRRGAGAYICGEETALFNSLEGFRGEPRNKPPFPVEVGLFGKPTAINNVETLVNVLDIIARGGVAYAARGTAQSAGTKLFCLCGMVERPGIYEVALGTKLSDLIALAGGARAKRPIQAVLLGGAAGTFLKPAELDVPLTFEDTRKIGATMGSGVVFVLDDSVPLIGTLRRLAEFFRDESCGQCVPCRVGTVRQEELLARVERGELLGAADQEKKLLAELGTCMRDASICGLGQTASSAVESAIAKFGIFDARATR